MADTRIKRPGELNPQLTKLMADVASMREQIAVLEARVQRLEVRIP